MSDGTFTVKEALPLPPDSKVTVTVCEPAVGVNVQVLSALDVTLVEQAAIGPSLSSINEIVVSAAVPVPLILAVIVTVWPSVSVVDDAVIKPKL